ncbi:MAG: hypothetical protein B9S32_13190 [Verrucomicrobia bacterium Tous-C9LFEB]|nr:MAG: hypothetical protein B9S32_13190 [Verrucomicrobia bacterium Tous-C9LFEB]
MNLIHHVKNAAILTLACVVIGSLSAHAQTILTETFNTGTAGTTFIGKTVSGGGAAWVDATGKNEVSYTNRYANASGNFTSQYANLFVLAGASDAFYVNYDLSSLAAFTVNIGQIQITSAGSCYLGARETSLTSTYCTYQFAYTATGLNISYVDSAGALTLVGTTTTRYLTNVSLLVTDTTQQLYINGTAFDSIARATQAVAGGTAQYFGIDVTASASVNTGLYLDTITYTVVPEPVAALSMGMGLIGLALYDRASKRRKTESFNK